MRVKLAAFLAFAGLFATASPANWGPAVAITNNKLDNVTYYTNGHKVVFGQNGVGHLVWYDENGRAVYYSRFYPGKGWTKELKLCKESVTPSIALDSDGTTIHVVWCAYKHVGSTNYHVFYQKCIPTRSGTAGWVGSPADLCENTLGHLHNNPSVACGPDGQVVASWEECWGNPDSLYSVGFREYASGSWQPQGLISEPGPCYRFCPSIATGSNGDVSVACYGNPSPDGRSGFEVLARQRLDGVWQAWEDATAGMGTPCSFILPDIGVDPTTGYSHVVCHSYQVLGGFSSYHIFHTLRTDAGWAVPQQISDAAIVADDCTPSMCFDEDGSAHVVWSRQNPACEVIYSVRNPATGQWHAPITVTSGSYPCYSPGVSVSADGSLYAVWTRYDAKARHAYQIWGSASSGSFGGPAADTTAARCDLALDVSPNPATRATVVSYSLPVAANVSVGLYDVKGSLVRSIGSGREQPGRHATHISVEGLARGIYILRLRSDTLDQTRKLVVE